MTTSLSLPHERWLASQLQRWGAPGLQLALWDGSGSGPEDARGRLVVRDRRTLASLLLQPDLAFGDAFADGSLDVQGDLVEVLVQLFETPPNAMQRFAQAWRHRRGASNTRNGSRRNIHRHYDLGNDFYALWLDAEMVYTCAYFPTPASSLEEAQRAKLEHVARKLWIQPGERVLELGCGWGALGLHLAREHGAHVTAYNISSEQIRFARERARREGLDDRVTFVEDDYRNARGSFDAIASVGMLEHVGARNHKALGQVIDRCLRDDGRGLVHSIGRVRPLPMNPWIERRIFPGAYAPTLSEMSQLLARVDLAVLDAENLRLHYAKTLEHWLERYEKNVDAVRDRFGESFVRAWRLYLAGSIAAFRTSSLHLWQLVFARPGTELPWTREHLYRRGREGP
jgi:cyclopropane-fatty-acyl-phospholipid synthase